MIDMKTDKIIEGILLKPHLKAPLPTSKMSEVMSEVMSEAPLCANYLKDSSLFFVKLNTIIMLLQPKCRKP